jgi:hypothetical protein
MRRNSSLDIGGCRVVDAFHCAMYTHMGCPNEN